MEARTYDLEDRLITFAIAVVKLTEAMPGSAAGRYYADQLLRSGGSPALHYGEAQGGESHRDFTHKIKIALKELREAQVCLRIIKGAGLHPNEGETQTTLKEATELVAIFTKSVQTAEQRSSRR
ncbi:MAG TPA: four helix bundle protein [Flavobacteriales bacterium]|jgi:four helix bundle protein|nr:four helix bundle protein [Flavobacteriales bacterium]